jgi:hypothetical protein
VKGGFMKNTLEFTKAKKMIVSTEHVKAYWTFVIETDYPLTPTGLEMLGEELDLAQEERRKNFPTGYPINHDDKKPG